MPTSSRFAVAVHILAALAVNEGRPVRSVDLARSASTNAAVVRSLLSRLAHAGFSTAQMGLGGGALLAKPASEISLLDVYRTVEDCDIFTLHRSPPDETCLVGKHVQAAMRPALDRARGALENELAQVTIANIAADIARLGAFRIPLPG
ncbi:MAG: Rrf2 family transcriptional regulator [Qingshengfaniella sp.]